MERRRPCRDPFPDRNTALLEESYYKEYKASRSENAQYRNGLNGTSRPGCDRKKLRRIKLCDGISHHPKRIPNTFRTVKEPADIYKQKSSHNAENMIPYRFVIDMQLLFPRPVCIRH